MWLASINHSLLQHRLTVPTRRAGTAGCWLHLSAYQEAGDGTSLTALAAKLVYGRSQYHVPARCRHSPRIMQRLLC
jgi:hypothetical protein